MLIRLCSNEVLNRPRTMGLTNGNFVFFLHAHKGKVFRQDYQFGTGINRLTNQATSLGQIGRNVRPGGHLYSGKTTHINSIINNDVLYSLLFDLQLQTIRVLATRNKFNSIRFKAQ